jgi:hypothetical protein
MGPLQSVKNALPGELGSAEKNRLLSMMQKVTL